jgi:hypothetical protein
MIDLSETKETAIEKSSSLSSLHGIGMLLRFQGASSIHSLYMLETFLFLFKNSAV